MTLIKHPESLMGKAAAQSGGVGLEAPESSPRWQETAEVGVGRVTRNAVL